MPRRRSRVKGEFSHGNLLNLVAIPFLTAAFGLIGWYYLTNDKLSQHDKAIVAIQLDTKQSTELDRKEREKVRNEFLSNQLRTTDILGKLETRLAVSETKQETANQTLNKIADELSRISTVSGRSR